MNNYNLLLSSFFLLLSLPKSMTDTQNWYIVKHSAGNCEIVPISQLEDNGDDKPEIVEKWGPFTSKQDAIARRVGLIRAGKCQPQ
jgi:hypothetical protein